MDLSGVSHNDSADAIFIGCCWNISLPWWSPVNNNPAVAANATQHPRMVAGRYMAWVSESACVVLERTSHQALTAATKVPAVSSAPLTVWVNAACAVLLVSSTTMLLNSARPVVGL